MCIRDRLNILAIYNRDHPDSDVSIKVIQEKFWAKYGRTFFTRYDFEQVSSESAAQVLQVLEDLVAAKDSSVGKPFAGNPALTVADCGDFSYTDLDGSVSEHQGLYAKLSNGCRFVVRLSGTGSSGATIRLYVEKYTDDASKYSLDVEQFLGDDIKSILKFLKFCEYLGTDEPTVRT